MEPSIGLVVVLVMTPQCFSNQHFWCIVEAGVQAEVSNEQTLDHISSEI
jgi:hypothetical protein